MKQLITMTIALLMGVNLIAQNRVSLSDFESLNNTSWKGKLIYKDYQSGKQESIDATMQIELKNGKIVMNVQYTYEPSKNNKSSVKLRNDGTYFGNEKIEHFSNTNGTKTLVTSYVGKDNGKKANMRMTRTLTDSTYSVVKEVTYFGEEKSFVRNRYDYKKT
ncbi:hypothetical protein Q2T40_11400 [Winogradskyella maritima]|uniref:Uncharacterized protein n=1 Tax=Winogradskyella maritima TaxID=1517766 RepID=A0ABV8AJ25_9FLAO|nr:hypothetical protein [Winogradskyella maritima]